MRERPILFSAPMVRAILDGRKTVTRRIVKARDLEWMDVHQGLREPDNAERCPYGAPGDRMWAEGAWSGSANGGARLSADDVASIRSSNEPQAVLANRYCTTQPTISKIKSGKRWRSEHPPAPAPNSPRWASRILLEITEVRVERLQEISEADAVAEGCKPIRPELVQDGLIVRPGRSAVEEFRLVWEQIHGGGSWEKNPFVWVVTFRRIDHA